MCPGHLYIDRVLEVFFKDFKCRWFFSSSFFRNKFLIFVLSPPFFSLSFEICPLSRDRKLVEVRQMYQVWNFLLLISVIWSLKESSCTYYYMKLIILLLRKIINMDLNLLFLQTGWDKHNKTFDFSLYLHFSFFKMFLFLISENSPSMLILSALHDELIYFQLFWVIYIYLLIILFRSPVFISIFFCTFFSHWNNSSLKFSLFLVLGLLLSKYRFKRLLFSMYY